MLELIDFFMKAEKNMRFWKQSLLLWCCRFSSQSKPIFIERQTNSKQTRPSNRYAVNLVI